MVEMCFEVNISMVLFQRRLFPTPCFHLAWLLRTTVPSLFLSSQVSAQHGTIQCSCVCGTVGSQIRW